MQKYQSDARVGALSRDQQTRSRPPMTIPVHKAPRSEGYSDLQKNQEKSGGYRHFLRQPPDLVGEYPEADQPLGRSLLDAV
jgi:hypothetical protein